MLHSYQNNVLNLNENQGQRHLNEVYEVQNTLFNNYRIFYDRMCVCLRNRKKELCYNPELSRFLSFQDSMVKY